jgi:UV DNA damage endonuclease
MSSRNLGFAVKVVGEPGLPSHDTRRWQSKPHLSVSLERLRSILKYLARVQIGMYRLSSALVPYGTHPDLPEFHGQIEDCAAQLADLGFYANELGVRLSSHPGQYVVLNSASERVSEAAARDVELQSRLFDAMGLGPDAVVVIHVGSGEGGHEAGKIRFLRAVERLSERARARLVIENDDRVFALKHVLEISERTGLRVVWDVLHHHCNDPDGLSDRGHCASRWPPGPRSRPRRSTTRHRGRRSNNGSGSAAGNTDGVLCFRRSVRTRTWSTPSPSNGSCAIRHAA